MPAGLILQFTGMGVAEYDRVNALLNIDQKANTGDWPAGLLSHAAGTTDDGLAVIEVWESRDAQARFMQGRLGRALQEGGITAVPTVTWIDLVSYNLPQGAAKG
jgi:hypothetical protein